MVLVLLLGIPAPISWVRARKLADGSRGLTTSTLVICAADFLIGVAMSPSPAPSAPSVATTTASLPPPTVTTSVVAIPAAAPPIVTSPAGPPVASISVKRPPAPRARPSAASRVPPVSAPAPAAGSPEAFAPLPLVPATSGACTASPRDSTPGDGGEQTVTVHTTAGATVSLEVHYKTSTHPFSGVADGAGTASVTFSIGRPTPGYPVRVDVSTSSGQVCSTQFTPQ
jgi:hypothetical protein